MKMKPSDQKLSQVLAEWSVEPKVSGGFRPEVWARLGRARGDAAWAGFARARAVPFAVLMTVALGLGAWTGREQARGRVAVERAEMLQNYVSGLDARAMAMR